MNDIPEKAPEDLEPSSEENTVDEPSAEENDDTLEAFEEEPGAVLGLELNGEENENEAQNPVSENTDPFFAAKLDSIEQKLDLLSNEFQDKLKTDTIKEKIIDSLHQELQEYKKDIFKKQFRAMILDLVNVVDDLRRLANHYKQKPPGEEDFSKLLQLFETIPEDLEDIFKNHGINPFTCSGDAFDPKRQKVLKKIETQDKASDKTIAKSLRPGYEWDDWVIRPEMVEACVYKEP